ncbi:P-loop containing nucleoside triphosphate hydrolase protein, partial [Dimargaris cristalligena]
LKEAYGVDELTVMQGTLLRNLLRGEEDVILQGQTGTGKSFCFLVYLMQIFISKGHPSALVLVPNTELALQWGVWAQKLLEAYQRCLVRENQPRGLVLAGAGEVRTLAAHVPWLIIATPQRVQELVNERHLNIRHLSWLVLDEIDHLLRLPSRFARFNTRLTREKNPKPTEVILDLIYNPTAKPADRTWRPRLLVNSATVNRTIRFYLVKAKQWTNDHAIFINALPNPTPSSPDAIVHHCLILDGNTIRNLRPREAIATENAARRETAYGPSETDLDDAETPAFTPKFLEHLRTEQGIKATGFDGRPRPSASTSASSEEPTPQIYVMSEFIARGLDIPNVTHVVIVGFPSNTQSYIHMAGRTGRMGRSGKVFTILQNQGSIELRAHNLFQYFSIQPEKYDLIDD